MTEKQIIERLILDIQSIHEYDGHIFNDFPEIKNFIDLLVHKGYTVHSDD